MNVYLLFTCDEWKCKSSMSLLAATDDFICLCALASREVLAGRMSYGGETGTAGLALLRTDYRQGRLDWGRLEYGFVDEQTLFRADDPELVPFVDNIPNSQR